MNKLLAFSLLLLIVSGCKKDEIITGVIINANTMVLEMYPTKTPNGNDWDTFFESPLPDIYINITNVNTSELVFSSLANSFDNANGNPVLFNNPDIVINDDNFDDSWEIEIKDLDTTSSDLMERFVTTFNYTDDLATRTLTSENGYTLKFSADYTKE